MSIIRWATSILVALMLVAVVLVIWRLSDLPPLLRGALLPLATAEAIKTGWSAEGMTSEQYQQLLKSNARLVLSAAVMQFVGAKPKPTFERVVAILGPPDDLLGLERVLEQYGTNEWHDKCIRYRLGRSQTVIGDLPKLDQFLMLQVCFKDGQSTVSYVAGLEDGDPLANLIDTRLYSFD